MVKYGTHGRVWEGYSKHFGKFYRNQALVKGITVQEISPPMKKNVTARKLLEGTSDTEGILTLQLTQRSH